MKLAASLIGAYRWWILGGISAVTLLLAKTSWNGQRYFGPVSDHFDGRRFRNENHKSKAFWDFMRWRLIGRGKDWPKWIENPPGVVPDERVNGGDLHVTFINHATFLLQTRGMNILTDPVWSHRVGPYSWLGISRRRNPGLALEQIPKIDVIIISHDHYDHLDTTTVEYFIKRDNPKIYYGLGIDVSLRKEGYAFGQTLDWWQGVSLNQDLKLTFVPAQHFSGRWINDHNATLWGGYVIETPEGPVYFAGDTGFGPHFQQIRDRFGKMRVALLPIGAFMPRWFMHHQHTNPEDSVRAHLLLEAEKSFGMHFGTFPLADESPDDQVRETEEARRAYNVSPEAFVIPEFGARYKL